MKVDHATRMSLINPVSVFIFLYIMLYLHRATAVPPASIYPSNSYHNNNNFVQEGFYSEFYFPTFRLEFPGDTILERSKQSSIVFINHHRLDVGKTFASHLSRSLLSRGLRIGTVETASVHIAVFSKNYAKSVGCLNEIRIMLKSGADIIPVFYDVNPSDLACHVIYAPVLQLFRWTIVNNGALYCKDLSMLEEEKTFDHLTREGRQRYDSNTITEWRKSLFYASQICGFERAAFNGDEGRLVHDLVEDVLSIKPVSSIEEPKRSMSYDVFINHRGTDVKNTLASHLYYGLQSNGLRVFFDKEEAQKGHKVNSEVENAINGASVQIVIFSRRYAESEWCMDELLLMVMSHSVIIPVFYDVKPSDIRFNRVDGMDGVYAEALHFLQNEKTFDPQTHQEKPRYDSDTIQIWKGVLMEVAKRDGFQLETYDGDEGQLVDNVLREVDKHIKQKQRQLTGKLSRCS